MILSTKRLGSVGVDSGTLMIVDPCYVDDGDLTNQMWLDALYDANGNPNGGEVAGGIVFPTRDGDGSYPVDAIYNHNGLAGVVVWFSESEQIDDEDEMFQ